jgi:hypothetical protein
MTADMWVVEYRSIRHTSSGDMQATTKIPLSSIHLRQDSTPMISSCPKRQHRRHVGLMSMGMGANRLVKYRVFGVTIELYTTNARRRPNRWHGRFDTQTTDTDELYPLVIFRPAITRGVNQPVRLHSRNKDGDNFDKLRSASQAGDSNTGNDFLDRRLFHQRQCFQRRQRSGDFDTGENGIQMSH